MIDKGYVVVYNEGVGGSSPRKLSELKVGAAAEGSGGLQSVQPGANITIDNTDPQNPVVSASGGGSSNPPKPIDLRPQPVPPTLSVDEASTVIPVIDGYEYTANFSADFGMSVINLSEGAANGWWIAWKPATGVTDTANTLVFTDTTQGGIAYGYVHGVGLQVQVGSTPPITIDADFSPNDTVVVGINADGSYWIATSNVPLMSYPATPPLSISSIGAWLGNLYAGAVTLSGEIIVDEDLLEPTLKGYVVASELPPYSSQGSANWPPEGVSVGDTFYVTHGGTLQGVEYKDPDENFNYEGFKVLGLPAPEESLFDLLPINKVDASVLVESVQADEDYALGFIFDNTAPANPVLTTELPGYLRPHRIGYSTEQYTELYYDNISFYRGGDFPYFTRLSPNTSGESVNVTLPAASGTLARLEDLPDAIKKTSVLTSSSGVINIDCADGIDTLKLTVSENITEWQFINKPAVTTYVEKQILITRAAGSGYTCVSPATLGTAGGAWTINDGTERLGLIINNMGDVELYPSGVLV